MPVLHINDQQYPLKAGTTRIGAPDVADVPIGAVTGVQAIVDVQQGASATIRRAASDASVRVNGVALGAEPTPLLHGDRIEIGGAELRYADDQKGGATQFVTSDDVAAMAARRGPAMATTGTGGRLVSLVDGKEYGIPVTGLVIGREVGADVVVPLAEVSRRHAEIVPTAEGYRLTDLSTNGVLVNGERVVQSRILSRADVIRVGSEEFRFYADVAKPAAATPASAAPAAPAAPATAAATGTAPLDAPASPSAPGGRPVPPVTEAEPARPAPAAAQPAGHPAAAKPGAQRRPAPQQAEPATPARSGSPLWIWVLAIILIVVLALLVMG